MFPFGKNKVMPVSIREFISGKKCEVKIDPKTYDDPKYSITVEEANAIASGDFSAKTEPEEKKEKKYKIPFRIGSSKSLTWMIGIVGVVVVGVVFYHFFIRNRKNWNASGNKTQNGKNSNISYAKI